MSIGQFFSDMSWIVMLLFFLSFAFAIAEGLIPGFGVCGVMSILCSIGAMVVEGVFTKSIFAVLLLFSIILVVGLLLFGVFVLSAKHGWLKKTPIIESKTAISKEYNSTKDKDILVGRVGVVVSECKPVGKADFEGKVHTIVSRYKNIEVGKLVFVEEIKDNLIFVKQLKGGENE